MAVFTTRADKTCYFYRYTELCEEHKTPCKEAFKNNKILKIPPSLTGTCSQLLCLYY